VPPPVVVLGGIPTGLVDCCGTVVGDDDWLTVSEPQDS
jgi:hypothetical protein